MANHNHIILKDRVEKLPFSSPPGGSTNKISRDALSHFQHLNNQLANAADIIERRKGLLPERVKPMGGSYIDVKMYEDANNYKSLDGARNVRLMNVRSLDNLENNQVEATLFIPRHNKWVENKLQEYKENPPEGKKRSNERLVNAIDDIKASTLESFFSRPADFARVGNHEKYYELWLSSDGYDESNLFVILKGLGIWYSAKPVKFSQVVIYLIKANRKRLELMIDAIDYVSEIREYIDPSILTSPKSRQDEIEFVHLLSEDTQCAPNKLSRIGIIDSGVDNKHPMLSNYLPDERLHTVIGQSLFDNYWHGTGMAGLALFGDLAEAIVKPNREPVFSDLSSVKILPDDDEPENEKEMYAVIYEDAMITARNDNAEVLCSAVTNDDVDTCKGMASATSAAIDETLYDNGECGTLMILAAGNTINTLGGQYPDYLLNSEIHDPAQSWNALTVGAYTEKVAIKDLKYIEPRVIAQKGQLSPFTSTSYTWDVSIIKPEIVMEGGNGIENGHSIDAVEDLSLATTAPRDKDRISGVISRNSYFMRFNATSAASALAAQLAGKIKYFNPDISALTVRALMVHSAEWTNEMESTFIEDGKLDVRKILHSCGYGVPDEKKAIASSDSYVTFIAEDAISPFGKSSGDLKFSKMNLYELPWPKDVLHSLGEVDVKLKITLSFYIEPSPGCRERFNKYTYPSIHLYFDLNNPTESRDDFIKRVSRLGDGEKQSNDPRRWRIGIKNRNQGSIISDSVTMSAIQMASCNFIAVYPSGGWYKYRKSYLNQSVKYALVVSLETPSQDIYTEIAEKVGIVNKVNV